MAFLGSLFSSILPALSSVVSGVSNAVGSIPLVGGALKGVISGIGSLVGGGQEPAQNPANQQYIPKNNLVDPDNGKRAEEMKANRLEGLVDSLLSKVGNSSSNSIFARIARSEGVKSAVKNIANKAVSKAKSRSNKFDQLSQLLGV